MYETALKYGVIVRANTKVASVNIKPDAPSVTLESGEEIVADVIIGADGCHSLSRQVMFGDQDYIKRKNIVMYKYVMCFSSRWLVLMLGAVRSSPWRKWQRTRSWSRTLNEM